jgi:NTE family protein
MVVGVSGNPNVPPVEAHEGHSPSLAKMIGHVFNSAFIDALENDMEHLVRVNELLGIVKNENPHAPTGELRMVDFLCINPSIEIDQLVSKHIGSLPRSMRAMLNITGATPKGGGTSLASYLLFEGAFCSELIDYGYRDAMDQREMLEGFFHPPERVSY